MSRTPEYIRKSILNYGSQGKRYVIRPLKRWTEPEQVYGFIHNDLTLSG